MTILLSQVLEQFAQDTLTHYSKNDLHQAYKELQHFYNARKQGQDLGFPSFTTPLHRLVYVICRMPATYTVINTLFSSLNKVQPFAYQKFLDLGCGSGAGVWAAVQHWPSLKHITAVDQDSIILQHARQLLSPLPQADRIDWRHQKMTPPKEEYDVILLSYVLNESDHSLPEFLKAVWEKCTHTLIIIEPGTPKGFQQCLDIRRILIDQGAYIIAPCGHEGQCPLQAKQDWCHFEQRVDRLSLHRFIKEGTLGYEQEAYSYIVASRTPLQPFHPRIVRAPLKRTGQVIVDLCVPQQLKRLTLTKRHPLYKNKKALRWGERLFIQD